MTDPNKTTLWEELKLLQATVDKFDDFSFRIKNWFITIVIAITGYALSNSHKNLLYLNFAVALIFYLYEITYRISQGDFLKRLRDVQCLLRGEMVLNDENKSPNMDKYLFDIENISDKSLCLRVQRLFKLEEGRAKRNVRELHLICGRSWKYLFQFRISLLYWLILMANSILLLILRFT
jgi:hypothetical protein